MQIDRQGHAHDDNGRFSPVLWGVLDLAGRRVTLTRAALRHARGEDEQDREIRAYLTRTVIRQAVEQGKRYDDETHAVSVSSPAGWDPARIWPLSSRSTTMLVPWLQPMPCGVCRMLGGSYENRFL